MLVLLCRRAEYGVPEDRFVFANFNQIYKIDPAIFAVWMRILKRVPGSCLWLLRFPPTGEMNIRAAAAGAFLEHMLVVSATPSSYPHAAAPSLPSFLPSRPLHSISPARALLLLLFLALHVRAPLFVREMTFSACAIGVTAAEGIADDRIIFTNVAPKEEHIRRGYLADLFLDTPVCNAHTTGCDILWSGAPMITVPGERMASRVAASLLNAVGLAELVVDSLERYVHDHALVRVA